MDVKELMAQIEAKTARLSFSSLRNFATHPEAFVRYKTEPRVQTEAMVFGSLVHHLVLEEEDTLEEKFIIGANMPTSEAQHAFANEVLQMTYAANNIGECGLLIVPEKAWEEAFKKHYKQAHMFAKTKANLEDYIMGMLSGKMIVTAEQLKRGKWLKDRVWDNPVARGFLDRTVATEQRYDWTYNGWDFVSYLDGVSDEQDPNSFIVDLKLSNPEPRRLSRQVFDMKWYVQGAMYKIAAARNGRQYDEDVIIGIDPKLGDVSVHVLDSDYLNYGAEEFRLWLQDFERCKLFKKWRANYEFYGERTGIYKGAYIMKKPYWAPGLKPVFDDPEDL